jgi:hypothetical protein
VMTPVMVVVDVVGRRVAFEVDPEHLSPRLVPPVPVRGVAQVPRPPCETWN